MTVLLFFAGTAPVAAQFSNPKKSKKEVKRKGPDGVARGRASAGNADRKLLLDRQSAIAKAQANGGGYTGPKYSLPKNQYETGKGGFAAGTYQNKVKAKKTKQKKSKKVIDQENPNGRLYQAGLKKRNRKFLFF
ncbi:hypothetical protein [Rufibacter sp. LB8]|uniref:hypothetical protein n=1 Tax=Rufibacter sp. LB8 TaxID=2777781 RepID=UPI00178C1EE7|nr:hypothetical protein [Rufibacter sp. LB8]